MDKPRRVADDPRRATRAGGPAGGVSSRRDCGPAVAVRGAARPRGSRRARDLVAAEAGVVPLLGAMIRARGRFHRLTRASEARRLGARPPAEIVADYRRLDGSRRHPPGTSVLDPLLDVLVHTQDIAVPLGRRHVMPVDAARAAADGCSGCRASSFRRGGWWRTSGCRPRMPTGAPAPARSVEGPMQAAAPVADGPARRRAAGHDGRRCRAPDPSPDDREAVSTTEPGCSHDGRGAAADAGGGARRGTAGTRPGTAGVGGAPDDRHAACGKGTARHGGRCGNSGTAGGGTRPAGAAVAAPGGRRRRGTSRRGASPRCRRRRLTAAAAPADRGGRSRRRRLAARRARRRAAVEGYSQCGGRSRVRRSSSGSSAVDEGSPQPVSCRRRSGRAAPARRPRGRGPRYSCPPGHVPTRRGSAAPRGPRRGRGRAPTTLQYVHPARSQRSGRCRSRSRAGRDGERRPVEVHGHEHPPGHPRVRDGDVQRPRAVAHPRVHRQAGRREPVAQVRHQPVDRRRRPPGARRAPAPAASSTSRSSRAPSDRSRSGTRSSAVKHDTTVVRRRARLIAVISSADAARRVQHVEPVQHPPVRRPRQPDRDDRRVPLHAQQPLRRPDEERLREPVHATAPPATATSAGRSATSARSASSIRSA